MKKILFVSAFISSTLFSVAQVDWKMKKQDPLAFVEARINFAAIRGHSESYSGSVPGAYIGASIGILQLNSALNLSVGAGYSMQGSKYRSYQYIPGGEGTTSDAKVRLNYIVAPVTVNYNSNAGFFAKAGVQPGFLTSAKDKHDGESEDLKDYYKGFDMSLVLGVGYRFKNRFGVGVNYLPGLSNINKKLDNYTPVKDHNSVVSIGASYKL